MRVGEERRSGGCAEATPEQEIPVAVHDADLQPGSAGRAQGADDFGMVGLVNVIITNPGFEKITQNVKRLSLPGTAGKKLEKQTSRPG